MDSAWKMIYYSYSLAWNVAAFNIKFPDVWSRSLPGDSHVRHQKHIEFIIFITMHSICLVQYYLSTAHVTNVTNTKCKPREEKLRSLEGDRREWSACSFHP